MTDRSDATPPRTADDVFLEPGLDPGPAYRPNVGVVLFNSDGRVWLGHRAGESGPHAWQFPQGGVDPGERLEAAARRELEEETGVRSAVLLDHTRRWLPYDFPPEILANHKRARGFLGQKQIWFAFRFTGDDAEVDLFAHGEVEFDAWRWAGVDEVVDLVVPFKAEVYRTVLAAFARFGDPSAHAPT